MRRTMMIAGLVAAIAAPSLTTASAASARTYCDQRAHDRKVTGTVLGAVGGALIGNAISHRNGALIGGLGGAVVGNQIARTKCTGYASSHYRHRPAAVRSETASTAYDRCRYENRPFYDERGRLIYQPTRVCR